MSDLNDKNVWWEVISDKKHLSNGEIIRLRHVETGMFLHSHAGHKSPSSK